MQEYQWSEENYERTSSKISKKTATTCPVQCHVIRPVVRLSSGRMREVGGSRVIFGFGATKRQPHFQKRGCLAIIPTEHVVAAVFLQCLQREKFVDEVQDKTAPKNIRFLERTKIVRGPTFGKQ